MQFYLEHVTKLFFIVEIFWRTNSPFVHNFNFLKQQYGHHFLTTKQQKIAKFCESDVVEKLLEDTLSIVHPAFFSGP